MFNGSSENRDIHLFVSMQELHDIPDYKEYYSISSGVYAGITTNYVDNTGDNISKHNKYFAEYSKFYWIWKNLKPQGIIGFCQYRRYLWLNNPDYRYLEKTFEKLDDVKDELNPIGVGDLLQDADIIMSAPFCMPFQTVEEQYCAASCQRASDWDLMKEVLLQIYPEYEKDFYRFAKSHYIYAVNMFVTNTSIFNDYMEWIFNIFSHLSQKIELPTNPYQYRVYSYLAERLINLFVMHNRYKVKRVPLLFKNGKTEVKAEYDTPTQKEDYFITDLSYIYCVYGFENEDMPKECKSLVEMLKLHIEQFCKKCQKVYVYGAGIYGRLLLKMSKTLQEKFGGWIETNSNCSIIDGFPIKSVKEMGCINNEDIGVLVAIKDKSIQKACLHAIGQWNVKKTCYDESAERENE